MTYEDLILEKEGHLATITLSVPEKLNALTTAMRRSLPLVADEVARDDEIRVVILTGAGRGFCSGVDVTAMASRAGKPQSRFEQLETLGASFCDVLFKLHKPVVAAINGPCAGGGFSLALTCDIRIAAETARFGAAQINRALVPDFGLSYFLPSIVGMSQACELMFTGKLIDATEALRLGIVSRVVPGKELMKVVRELAAQIAQQPPVAVELTKKMVYRRITADFLHQLDLETYAQNLCRQTEDHAEAVRTFLEKQPPPHFKGR